jgi:hypothetical protein
VRPLEYFGACRRRGLPTDGSRAHPAGIAASPKCSYEELAQHDGTTVLPARPLHRRDKGKVEVAVPIAQEGALALDV